MRFNDQRLKERATQAKASNDNICSYFLLPPQPPSTQDASCSLICPLGLWKTDFQQLAQIKFGFHRGLELADSLQVTPFFLEATALQTDSVSASLVCTQNYCKSITYVWTAGPRVAKIHQSKKNRNPAVKQLKTLHVGFENKVRGTSWKTACAFMWQLQLGWARKI